METRSAAEPKDARTAGAQAASRLLPNKARTTGVSTTTSEPLGDSDVGPSVISLLLGKPCAASAAHITRSQETVASRPTCCATQRAASSRTAVCLVAAASPAEGRV